MFGKHLQEQRALLFALTAVLGLVFCASLPARADTVKLTFDIPAPLAPPPGSPPWATMTLTLNLDQSIIGNFSMAPGQGLSASTLCFDVVGSVSGFTVTGLPGGWSAGAFLGNAGCFALSFRDFDAFLSGLPTQSALNFNISRTGGFSSVFDLIQPSVGGSPNVDWLTDVFQGSSIGLAGAVATPEPGAILLFGSGIPGLAGVLRRRLL
jgi:hypothetical protein